MDTQFSHHNDRQSGWAFNVQQMHSRMRYYFWDVLAISRDEITEHFYLDILFRMYILKQWWNRKSELRFAVFLSFPYPICWSIIIEKKTFGKKNIRKDNRGQLTILLLQITPFFRGHISFRSEMWSRLIDALIDAWRSRLQILWRMPLKLKWRGS